MFKMIKHKLQKIVIRVSEQV